jgi:hypothetical protein
LKTKEYYNAPVYIDHTVITIFIVLSGFREWIWMPTNKRREKHFWHC